MQERERARQALRETFGFADFRPGQGEVVTTLLQGRSALAIFPTGAGKSLCYQLPALLFDGLTVVVSPLIALMKDQIDFLVRHRVAAARLDSTLEAGEVRRVLDDMRGGRLKLLYVAPERLTNERFLQTLKTQSVALMAIDEAHCISEWGHNFRPEYLKLARIAESLQVGRVLALTATAPPEVARDIARVFRIQDEDIVLTGFHRPNLELHVTPCDDDRNRQHQLVDRLKQGDQGSAIVYVTLQQTAEELADRLRREGLLAEAYHAGLKDELRHEIQDRFMRSETRVVVATIAFGMGIDKSDIRAVYHANLPKSLENYAQEIGRAGRDGEPARCELLACREDVITLENFTYGDTPEPEAIAGLLDHLLGLGEVFDISVYDLAQTSDIRMLVVQTLLTYLELEGVIVATGPFFDEYKFQPTRTSQEILARFDPQRADFLRNVFRQAREGRVWFTIDIRAAAEALGEPRERILKALNHLEEQGDLTVQVSGVRQGYRRTTNAVNVASLRQTLVQRFLERERRDIARVQNVLDYANTSTCLTRYLLTYFGESLPGPCGHCARCLGLPFKTIPTQSAQAFGPDDQRLVEALRSEGHQALRSSRQLARFLCGLSSPSAARGKLARHPQFGRYRDVPFPQVLAFLEKTA